MSSSHGVQGDLVQARVALGFVLASARGNVDNFGHALEEHVGLRLDFDFLAVRTSLAQALKFLADFHAIDRCIDVWESLRLFAFFLNLHLYNREKHEDGF
jgi:hypothetical protein